MPKPVISVLMGSLSDMETMKECTELLIKFGVNFEVEISSAHRTPEKTAKYATSAARRGIKIFIVGAGAAAHLGGMVAANTLLPVVAVPIDSSPLKGLDALLSTVQMPGGVPVACMAVGKAGAKNAAVYAVEILALSDAVLAERLSQYREEMVEAVEEQSAKLKSQMKKS